MTAGTDTEGVDDDPYRHIRKNRQAVERFADQERDDPLAAWARVMLALADGEEPAQEDLERTGLPVPEGGS